MIDTHGRVGGEIIELGCSDRAIKWFGRIKIPNWAEMHKPLNQQRSAGVSAVTFSEGFENLTAWQREDKGMQEMIERLQGKMERPPDNMIAAWPKSTQMVAKMWNRLRVVDNVLCRVSKEKVAKAIVPERWWVTVMKLYHEVPGTSHEGSAKMLTIVKEKYY